MAETWETPDRRSYDVPMLQALIGFVVSAITLSAVAERVTITHPNLCMVILGAGLVLIDRLMRSTRVRGVSKGLPFPFMVGMVVTSLLVAPALHAHRWTLLAGLLAAGILNEIVRFIVYAEQDKRYMRKHHPQ